MASLGRQQYNNLSEQALVMIMSLGLKFIAHSIELYLVVKRVKVGRQPWSTKRR